MEETTKAQGQQAGTDNAEQAAQAKKSPKKVKGKAKVAPKAKAEKAGAWKKDPKRIAQLKKDIPLGSLIRYTGGRVEEHEGKQGVVIGYRDANGLYVDFGKLGKGTVSVPKAEVVRKGPGKEGKGEATPKAVGA